MQIHELDNFAGSPSATDFFVIDDGEKTSKLALPVITKAEVDTGTDTAPKIVTAEALAQILANYPHIISKRINTSGWSYIKWSDGTIEAWCKRSGLAVTGTQWIAPIYYYDSDVSISASIFDGHVPQIVTMTGANDSWWPVYCIASDAQTIEYRIAKPTSNLQTYTVTIYAKYVPN